MSAINDCLIPFRSASGAVLGSIKITAMSEATSDRSAPIIQLLESEASEYGETSIQLRESERYEYEIKALDGEDLRLRSSLSKRRKSLGEAGGPDAGLIETRTFCGSLLLEFVQGPVTGDKAAVATTVIDIRSLKLDYRTEYRGMLRRMADELSGLVVDSRASAKSAFKSNFQERTDVGWLQIQIELLRETLESSDFSAALQRVLSFPNERLSNVIESVSTDRPIKWTSSAVRQLVSGNPRTQLPPTHPLRSQGRLNSVAERILLPIRSRDLDTPENRFIKHALEEFRAFLDHAYIIFSGVKGWGVSAALCKRLAANIDDWLGRSFFREIGIMQFAPLGSPVLQRKAGYREILRWWLRFRTAAELSWEGGEDLFKAGQRDVANLYEYWLFFILLDWFCKNCADNQRPAIDELVDGLEDGSPNLLLKKSVQLGPFSGSLRGKHRALTAKFTYNRRFPVTQDRHAGGSWTRRLHPDYTLTIWPAELTEAQSEKFELLTHIHFDAKYRVENLDALFGSEANEDSDSEIDGNYNRQDLLKMHAYRDAIKRSQGAYILYPGHPNSSVKFQQFHEILPGLGAFSISPDENGAAQGFESLELFLNDAIEHLTNRTTALEKTNFHIANAYRYKLPGIPGQNLQIPEVDHLDHSSRALPMDEQYVVIHWNNDAAQLAWSRDHCLGLIPINGATGHQRIASNFASARYLLLHASGSKTSEILWRMSTPGYRVLSAEEASALGYPANAGVIYAVFDIEPAIDWSDISWNNKELIRAARRRDMLSSHASTTGTKKLARPRLVTLHDLLISMAT